MTPPSSAVINVRVSDGPETRRVIEAATAVASGWTDDDIDPFQFDESIETLRDALGALAIKLEQPVPLPEGQPAITEAGDGASRMAP